MKKLFVFLWLTSIFTLRLLALSDPGFEITNPQELPLWKGAQWVKSSNLKYTAKVVENPKEAFSGKRFLTIENNHKGSVYCLGYPTQTCLPNYVISLEVKVKGKGLANIMIRPFDANHKILPWKKSQESGWKKITSDKWQTIKLTYQPEAQDVKFLVWCGVKDGKVDFDNFKLNYVKVAKKVTIPKKATKVVPKVVSKVTKNNAKVNKNNPHYIFCNFESWTNNLPTRWKKFNNDSTTIVKKALNDINTRDKFGSYSMYLNGKLVLDPPMTNLAVPRTRPMRLSFYAKGENGKIIAKLREGRDGFVDYLIDLVEEETTSKWKKYAIAFSLPNNARIDNATIELQGQNCFIDNLEFKAAFGSDGNLVYSIPIVKDVPKVDGKNSPGEWDFASGGSDPMQLFVVSYRNFKPVTPALKQQTSVKFCSDGTRLYFLMETPGASTMKKDADFRDDAVYLDDAVEIHFNPEYQVASPKESYQFIFNSKNTVFDQRRVKGGGSMNPNNFKWNAKSLVNKSSIVNDVWILEGSVELKDLNLAIDKPFGLNVCVSRRNPEEAGTLNGAPFLKLEQMVKATISKNLPSLYWHKNGDWGSILVTASNSLGPEKEYTIEFSLDAEKDLKVEKKTIILGQNRSVPMLFNMPGGAGKFGALKITMQDTKGNIVNRHVLDFNSTVGPLMEYGSNLEFHHLPEQQMFAINVHLKDDTYNELEKVELTGIDNKKYVYKKGDFTRFENTLVLKKPFVTKNNQKYAVNLLALNKNNEVINSITKKFTINNSLYPKENGQLCKDILAPYQAIKVKKNLFQVSLRDYIFNGSGLPQQIVANKKNVLYKAVSLVAIDSKGKKLTSKLGQFKIVKVQKDKVLFTGETLFPNFKVKLDGTMEYDGAIFYKATIIAPKPVKLNSLAIEVGFNQLDYFHSFLDSQLRLWMCRQPKKGEYRHPSVEVWTPQTVPYPKSYRRFNLYFFPHGDTLLWSSKNVIPGVIKNGFLPYLTFGNRHFGMELFADTDKGYIHDKNSSIHEIERIKGKEIVRTKFIAIPHVIDKTISFEFGLMATPGRKRSREERYSSFFNNAYSHSGFTDHALCGLRIKDFQLLNDQFARLKNRYPLFVNCKAFFPQMDKISIYMDSEWRSKPDYSFTASYKNAPSLMFGKNQRNYLCPSACYQASRLNFFGDRFRDIIKNMPAMPGVYWDENFMKPCNNPNHANCGYLLQDGQLQGRAWWRGVREVDRRVRQAFLDNNRPNPLIVMFTGEGLIPHAFSFGNINYLGEHLTFDMDYIDYWTPHFTEIACAGAWGFDVGILGMFREARFRNNPKLNRAQLALVKLYDSHFWPIDFNMKIYRPILNAEKRFGKIDKDVKFVNYLSSKGQAILANLPNYVKLSCYVKEGNKALVFISNLGNKDYTLNSLKLNLSSFGIKNYVVFNGETQKKIDVQKPVTINKHDFLLLEVKVVK